MELKRVLANSIFQAIAKLFTACASFLITIVIAHAYGSYEYGLFTKVITVVGFFYLLIDFGYNAIFLSDDYFKKRLGSFIVFRTLFGVVLMGFLFGILSMSLLAGNLGFFGNTRWYAIIFSGTIVSYGLTLCASAVFQKEFRYDLLAWATVLGSFVSLLLVGFAVISNLPSYAIYIALLVGGFCTGIVSLFLIKKYLSSFTWDTRFVKKLIAQSAPLGFMLFFNLVYFRADIIILSLFRSTQEVGAYGLAYRFFEFLVAVPLFLSNSVYPLLLRHGKNSQKLQSLIKKYGFVFFGISLVLVVFSWIFAPLLSRVNEGFDLSVSALRILVLFLPFFFMTSLLQWVLISQKKQKFLLLLYVSLGLFNIGLNVMFVPRYGLFASSVITGVSELLVFVAMIPIFLRLKIFHENT